jgi:hypothetical protein
MSIGRFFGGLGGLAMLGGCAGLSSPDPASPYYAWPAGGVVVLERPLTIPAGSATVRLQAGKLVPRNSVEDWAPFCVVELSTVRETPQTLQPGRFRIERMTRQLDTVAALREAWRPVGLGGDDAGPSFLYYFTDFVLTDPAQPQLMGMRCGWNQLAPGNRSQMRHLTLAEIRATLVGWLRVELPVTAL